MHTLPGSFWSRMAIERTNVPDRMAARTGRVNQERREPLQTPEHRDVIDLDIAVREPIPHVPADRQDDHLRRVPEALERGGRYGGAR